MPNITKVEFRPDKNGVDYKSATIDTEVFGKNRFNIFPRDTRYGDVVEGRTFATEEFVQDGQYIKLRDPDAGIKRGGGRRGGVDPVQVAQAQEHRGELVRQAQDNKDKAVRLASSLTHAVAVVTTFNKDLTPDEIKSKILNWRNWFLENWDLSEAEASEIPF